MDPTKLFSVEVVKLNEYAALSRVRPDDYIPCSSVSGLKNDR